MVQQHFREALSLNGSSLKIRDLPKFERPKEKAIRYGIDSLTNAELLAILINTGTRRDSAIDIANKLLIKYQTLTNLAKTSEISDLVMDGIKTNKALTLLASFRLIERIQRDKYRDLEYLTNTEEIAQKYIYEFSSAAQEMMLLVGLDKSHKIIKEQLLYVGTKSGFDIDPRAIVMQLKKLGACFFVLIHNHPSGNRFPSKDDLDSTAKIQKLARNFGILLLDHLIIADYTYFSFKDNLLVDNGAK